ncbi:MAG: hypothetical protein LAT77_06490 [Aliidiomarina sp.]|uniref:hypothetical protein n=1 Tax=Aliidiomarina sp. TaxID=1872439 RepID=UPI0025BCB3B1|nr:hypothetical protein [Aliidiomarina sp.]MCH8501543.1 hypothetical protein [Aliidiomarina sp.]
MDHLIIKVSEGSLQWSLESKLPENLGRLVDVYIQKRDKNEIMRIYLNTGFYKCDDRNLVHLAPFVNNSNSDDLQLMLWGEEECFDKYFKRPDAVKSIRALLESVDELPDSILKRVTPEKQ